MPKKKDKDKYAISNKYDVVREQLGLPVYSYTEERPATVELPTTEHPDVPFFSDIDVNHRKPRQGRCTYGRATRKLYSSNTSPGNAAIHKAGGAKK